MTRRIKIRAKKEVKALRMVKQKIQETIVLKISKTIKILERVNYKLKLY